ncbi:filamentous hemagglutinin N-terminal domain-containing protein [Vibrio mimicus]|uniref:two-partner secretion domain-containing protein n=1 Tax=Vibrio mimicus TaxID=674 RepID=UPI0011D4CDE3|nr:hemagglutinin repeat-containing protein [Vibrio mimicus]TXZ76534.1 filamentous hemagglutinin N-terminal domain-containing protein [Vibrio mimicus]
MDKRVTQGSVWFTYTLCGVLTLQPALANVVIDGNSVNTSKTQAGNGVEVINIATPNGKGLSHNKYQQFNVDPEGLILNNSTAQLSQSQLGGILQNNPNLKGKAADVILNEVTGANRSQLEGYTEVFGQQANVILANPYGITCDGCGFINTPRVTLSTGTPELNNDQLTGFDVSKGSVTIEGLGLDATNQTYFDIISRTAEINASIHANDLSVITGNNKVSYQSHQVTEKSPKPTSKPALAIDSSSLGGMYAGRISLVATEDGVGVNLGNLVSNVGDIVLTADGKVQLASAQSAQNIEITSSQDVALTNQQVAQEQLKISADRVALNQTTVTAGDLVELIVNEGLSVQNSQLFSGIKNNNQVKANAELNIKTAQLTLQGSEIVSKGKLSGHITSLELDSNSAVAASDIVLTDVEVIENNGEINVNSTLDVDAEQITLVGSGTMTADSIQIDVNSANLDSQITANTLSVKAQSILDIGQEANLQSTGTTTLNALEITQKGQLTSNGTINLDASTLTHGGEANANQIVVNAESLEQRGQLVAEQDISITASNANLSGKAQAKQTLQVTGEKINVAGKLEATQLDITSTSIVNIHTPAQLSAISQLSVDTNDVSNKGSIHSGGGLTIGAHTLEQQGALTSVGDLKIDTINLGIQSDIETQGNLNLSASSVTNNAQVIVGQNLNLSAQSLSNNGTLTAGGDTFVSLTNNFTHGLSGTISGQNVTLSAANVDNSGTLQSLDSLNLTVSSLVNKGGLVALGDLTTVVASGIDNQGLVYAGNNAKLYSNTLHNASDIVAGHDLLIAKNAAKQKNFSITNHSGTIESLGGDIGLYTNSLSNSRTMIDVESTTTDDRRAEFLNVFEAVDTEYQPTVIEYDADCGGGASDGSRTCIKYSVQAEDSYFTVIALKESSQLKSASSAGRIVAQNNLVIGAGTVLNRTSQIAGNNVTIDSGTLTNEGYLFDEFTIYYDYALNSSWTRTSFPFSRASVRKVKTGSSGQLNSSITASNNLTLNVANKVNNSTLKANATAVQPTKSASGLNATPSASVMGPTITFANMNDIAFPEFVFPSTPNGLFILSPDPKGKYLIETNPLLTNMGNFLGSDYFMSSVGFNPETDVKFLGDAFYDSRVISQAIFEQTGQQYLNASVGSQLDQMQQLMDAAASQKVSLNLTAGIALSSTQIASLTQDILWYEEIEVNGQRVLAPKLYLAQATIDNLSSGAQIAGSNVSIDAGDIENSGQLSADSSLGVNSANSITNIGGSIVGGDISLTAKKDIINLSGDIKGHDVSLEATNGSIVNETRVKTSTASLGNNHGTFTDVGKTATITSTENLALKAGKNIQNHAADIKANGDASLNARQDIIVSSKEETHGYDVTARGWRQGENETSQISANVTVGGNLTMSAGQDIAVTASQVTSSENLSLTAGNDITVQTALNKRSDHTYRSNYTEINRSEQHQGSILEGKNVSMQAQNDITLSGSTVSAGQTASLKAKGDVNILAVNDSEYHYDKTVSKKSFGRSKTTINETYQEQVKGSAITAGNDIGITAQNLDSAITAGGDSNINVIGSSLNAGGEVNLSADGDVTLAAQTYKEFERHETIKKGFGGLSGSHQGNIDDATLLNSSYLINSGNTNIQAGNDIGVIASEVSSGGEVNLNAVNNVLVAAGEVLKQSQEWNEKNSFLSGGNLFEMEKKREGQQSSTAQSSVIQSGGNLLVNGGSVTVIGSELQADKNIDLTADTGDVTILAAKEDTYSFSSEEKLSVRLGGGFNGVSFDDGQVKISLGDATYDKVKQQSDALSHKGSVITAGDNLSVDAESSILVEGSTLVADRNQDQSGDLTLTAKENVTIKDAVDTLSEQREDIHGKAEASLVVQHQALEVAKAAQALQQSTKKLKQAEQDYKQYKKGLDSLESTLSTLEQEYADKKPGVTFEDIEELNDLISEVKSDEAWYVAGVALAAEDVASKTTLLVQQTAAAAQSSGTYGFNAGLYLDIEASQTDSSTLTTTSVGSTLSGQSIKISAGNNTGNQLNIQGSELAANDTLSLAANEVNITASQDTHTSKSETQSGKISASMTVYGASSGINLNASFDRSQSSSSSKTHNNSQLSADNINIASAQDTNIKGATVNAKESLTLDVGGDLNVASVQDRHSSSNKGQGVSGGLSLSGGSDTGQLTGGSSGINASNGRASSKETVVTSLTSNGSLDINVGGNTDIKGATIAALNEVGKDSGKLNLTTGSLTYADLSNTNYSQEQSLGLNSSVGVNNGELDSNNNSTSLQYKNTSGYDKSKTLATIGQGNLNIGDLESSDDTSRLNRDIDQTEKDLFTVDRKQGDIDVTVDHRLLSEEGRSQIKEDVKRTELMGKSLADVALEDSVKLADTFEHMDVVQKELDVQLLIAQKKGDAAVNINNLENATAQQKQDAINDYAAAYSEVFGISIESALVIAVNKSIGGAHYTGDKGSNIVLNDKAMKNAQDYMKTLAHEVTHGLEKQGIIGKKGEQGENYAELIGGYAEGNYEFALENSGLGKVNKGNTNVHIGNDSKAVVDASEQFKTVQKSGAEVDYYLTQPEARRKAELTEFLLNCTDSSCRDTEEFKSKQKELVALNKKDEERDLAYKKACYSGGGEECNSESAKVVAAHDTWDKETAVKDSSLTSEYIDITSKNAEAEARPWELAAGSALAEMPTDVLIGAISAVPEMVDLATTASAAMQGDEGAQQQLKTMYESAVETMSDPNGAADKYIADIQAKEASGEISSFEAKKQISKFYISVAAAATGSAHGVVKLGDTSLNAIAKAGDSVTDIAQSKPHKTSSANDTQKANNIERAPGSTDSEAGLNSPLIASNSIFDAKGVDPTAPAVQDVRTDLYKEYKAAGVSDELAKSLADGNIKSGSTIPTKRTAKQGETLFKFVPSGNAPGRSSYYFTRTEYEYFKSNPDKLAQEAGLPYKNFVGNYDVYAIEPKPDVNPVVFESKVAEVQEGTYRAQGGANQTLVPNLKNWETPKKVDGLKVYGND